MAATLSGSPTIYQDDFSRASHNFTVATPSGSDRALVVKLFQTFDATSDLAAGSVTYGGQALTRVGGLGSGSTVRVEVWVLDDAGIAAASSTTLAWTNPAGENRRSGVIAEPWQDVDQATIFENVTTNSGNGTAGSVTVTSAAGNVAVGAFAAHDAGNHAGAGTTGDTEIGQCTIGAGATSTAGRGLASYAPGAASVDLDWTFAASEPWVGVGFSLISAGTADTTAPTLSNATAEATGATTATGSVDTDEAGTADAVLTTSATPPTATQIQAGQDHTGAAAAASDLGVAASVGTVNFSFTELAASTTYYLHAVVEDAATNVSDVATSGSFDTDPPPNEAPTVTITAPALASIAVTAGTPLRLTATATDAEDGDLSASIEWTSSNTDDGTGGDLGTGASIDVDTTGWSEEARTITATVADASLAEGSDSFTLTIGAAPAPSGGYLKALALVAPLGGY